MDENVALDSSKQRKFVKSIKGIKKLIKKNDSDPKSGSDGTLNVKDGKVEKRKRKEKGLVYLSHIPHGFYENEMTQYFKQFGVVTNARVIRSKRTGNSKGHAFVEFREPAVAEIVAETMNNYLMGKRLIKAAIIPPEKQKRFAFRKHWNATNNPGNNLRIKMKKAHNANKDEKGELQRAKKILSNLKKTMKKLDELGINYDFFSPVDIPAPLTYKRVKVENKEESKQNFVTIKKEETIPKDKKNKGLNNDKNLPAKVKKQGKEKTEQVVEVKQKQKKKNSDKVTETVQTQISNTIKGKKDKANIKGVKESVIIKTDHKQNKQKLQKAGVNKPLEDFVKLKEDTDTAESSDGFDSDEYEKMLENDSNVSSGDDSENSEAGDNSDESDSEDGGSSDEDDSEEGTPQIKKGKPVVNTAHVLAKKKAGKPVVKQAISHVALPMQRKKNVGKQKNKTIQSPQPQMKRKASQPQTKGAATKKLKFEKASNQKVRNTQFKKRK